VALVKRLRRNEVVIIARSASQADRPSQAPQAHHVTKEQNMQITGNITPESQAQKYSFG
jgi:hypothetical protein